jgi:hypothetical protein
MFHHGCFYQKPHYNQLRIAMVLWVVGNDEAWSIKAPTASSSRLFPVHWE